MTRQAPRRRRRRGIYILKKKGIQAIILGAVMLLVPLFASTPMLKTIAGGLRTPAWLAIGVGALFLGAYAILQRRTDKTNGLAGGVGMPLTSALAKSRGRFKLVEPTLGPAAETTAPAPNPTPASIWASAVFATIEWRRFEAVCETLFAQAGYTTRAQSHGADGGVDIWLHTADAEAPWPWCSANIGRASP